MPKMQGTAHQCSVLGCPLGNSPVGLWLFSLPCKDAEPALHTAWLERLRLTADQSHSPRICSRHFAEQDFVRHHQRIVGLKRTAVPTNTGCCLGGNHLVTCRASSSSSGAHSPERTALGVGALQHQGAASECKSLRDHEVCLRGKPRVQAPTAYGPLRSKDAPGSLGSLLEEGADADALTFGGSAVSFTRPSIGSFAVEEKGDSALQAAPLGAPSEFVLNASFGCFNSSGAHTDTVPSGDTSLLTSNAGLPVSAVGAAKSSAVQHQRGAELNSLVCRDGGHCGFSAQPSSLYGSFSALTGLAGASDACAHLPQPSDNTVLLNTEWKPDGISEVVSASSGNDFCEPADVRAEVDCSVDSNVHTLNPAVLRSRNSCGGTSRAEKVLLIYTEGQPRTSVGSKSVGGVVQSLPEGDCAADSCSDTVEPVVAEEATVFDPSMGTYIVEKETMSDEDGHGASAIQFRVSWAPNDDTAKKASSSGQPSSTRNGPASNYSGRRRKTS